MMEHKLNKSSKRNVVVLGLTGVGKSTLCNQLTASNTFAASDSMESVTSTIQYHDTSMGDAKYRIIDTPGFFDTNDKQESIVRALEDLAYTAREGIAAILIVVRKGRITEETEIVLKYIEAILGTEALGKFGILVVTHTKVDNDQLRSNFKALPANNLGRRLEETVRGRVVGTDNTRFRWTPYKTRKDVLSTVERLFTDNEHLAVDCKMMNSKRVVEQQQLEIDRRTAEFHLHYEEQMRKVREQMQQELAQAMEEQKEELQRQHELDLADLKRIMQGGQNGASPVIHVQEGRPIDRIKDGLAEDKRLIDVDIMQRQEEILRRRQLERDDAAAAAAIGGALGATTATLAIAAAAGACAVQ